MLSFPPSRHMYTNSTICLLSTTYLCLSSYGEFYIDQLQERVEKARLILSWVLIGEPYPVTSLEQSGAGLKPGFDSHYVLVKDFHPIQEGDEPTGDEIVVFDPHQVRPR